MEDACPLLLWAAGCLLIASQWVEEGCPLRQKKHAVSQIVHTDRFAFKNGPHEDRPTADHSLEFQIVFDFFFVLRLEAPGLCRRSLAYGVASLSASLLVGFGVWVVSV